MFTVNASGLVNATLLVVRAAVGGGRRGRGEALARLLGRGVERRSLKEHPVVLLVLKSMEGGWLTFPAGSFKNDYNIHPTLDVGWIRVRTKTGKWKYSGTNRLAGSDGKPRVVYTMIEGRQYYRHRLVALAKDGSFDGLSKFRSGRGNPVLHRKRRAEDARPDDDDVEFGSHAENRKDANNKKRKPQALGHPVILKNDEDGRTEKFGSVVAAAAFLGADPPHLRRYLVRKEGSGMIMPKYATEGAWSASYDEFELTDAVRLVRAAAELYLSPSHPNQLFRKLKTGNFCTTELERNRDGYVPVKVLGGGKELLHRLVVETIEPDAFDARVAALASGASKSSLQVDHIDGDESNNSIDNLRVVDRNEHARKHAFAIEWIDVYGNVLETFECAADVARKVRGMDGNLLRKGNVHNVCEGLRAHTGGQRFRWKDKAHVEATRVTKKC